MGRRQIAVLLALKELGIDLSVDTFDQRLIVQKAIYLTQAAGLDLGYYYGWYLRGPYCSAVAKDIFAALEDPQEMAGHVAQWSLDDRSKKALARLRKLLRSPTVPAQPGAQGQEAQARWLELLASVHFLIDRKQVAGHGAKEISGRLKAFNKDFGASEVEGALAELRRFNVLPAA
jgi:hypothetical protein